MDDFNNFFDERPRYPEPEKTPVYHTPEKKSHNNFLLILSIIVAVVMTALVIVNVVLLASLKNTIADEYAEKIAEQMRQSYSDAIDSFLSEEGIVENITGSATQQAMDALKSSIGEIAATHTPSVARIFMYTNATDATSKAASMATAFLISDATDESPQRYLVTNAHCVRYVATTKTTGGLFGTEVTRKSWASYGKILAVFDGDATNYKLEIVAYGAYKDDDMNAEKDQPDLAILKISGTQPSNEEHPSLKLADSDYLKNGTAIALIGNPQNIGKTASISTGCVSQTGIEISSWGKGSFILTDAAVNSGNSGGPMINSLGVVVGVVESKIVSEEIDNMGFALSASTLHDFIIWAQKAENNVQNRTLNIPCTYIMG